jgi:chloride channel protein, CIC family
MADPNIQGRPSDPDAPRESSDSDRTPIAASIDTPGVASSMRPRSLQAISAPLLRWIGRALPAGSGFEGQRYLLKWLLLSTAIGIVAGVGAVAFYYAIQFVTGLSLGRLVGYLPPEPVGEGDPQILPMARPWLLPLVTLLGGLLSGIIVFSMAPEAEGHGTDAAIDAIHHKRGRIRARIPPIKLVASALTIGTGGSGGREGPTAQISAGFGALLGQWLGLSAQDRRIAVAAGMGAGIGAIFRAPLGGAVMAAEILYTHDLEVEALIPALIASIVGYSIYGLVYGFQPIFGAQPQLAFNHPIQLLYYGALGVVSGLGGILYAHSFYGITGIFHRLAMPRWLKPALGGLLVGALGLLIPGALHTGYGWVQISMTQELLGLPLWVVLALPFARMLATGLSIGSGGSGGIFGPGMVIGGMLGASFWRLTHAILPQMPSDPAPFVIVGMMATFGGIAHAPLAVMLMVAEMTGNLSLLAPAMVAVAIATALVGDNTIYRAQLPSRADSPAHRVRFSFPLLSALLVRDAMARPEPIVGPDAPLSDIESYLGDDGVAGVIVVNERGEFAGTLGREQLQSVLLAERAATLVRTVAGTGDVLALDPDQTLDVALDSITSRGLSWAPVIEQRHVVGRLNVRDVMQTYKATLERSVRRAVALNADTALFEARLGTAAPLVGRTLREANLPRDTLVVSITRDGETLFPRAETRLEANDVVLIMADPASEPALRRFLEGAATAAPQLAGRKERGNAPRHAANILQLVTIGEAMTTDFPTIASDLPIGSLAARFEQTHHHGFPVLDRDGWLCGMITLNDLQRATDAGLAQDTPVGQIAARDLLVVYPDQHLDEAMWRFAQADVGRLPVVDRANARKLLGVLRRSDVIKAYSRHVARPVDTHD